MSELALSHPVDTSATLTLNQPDKRNPISPAMCATLIGALELFRKNASVRSVILTGTGDVFCSGLDLATLNSQSVDDPKSKNEKNLAASKSIRDFYYYLYRYPRQLIAAVNSSAVAGGAGVALVCDATIFSEKASICFGEVRLDFASAIFGVYLQLSIGIKKAKELMLSARRVSAHESLSLELADGVVPAG